MNNKEKIDRILGSVSQRMLYNLDQTFIRLRRDYNDEKADYEILDVEIENGMKTIKMFIEFTINGVARKTVLYSKELRQIKTIYDIIVNVIG